MGKTITMMSITRVLRVYLGMTQVEFAKLVGLTQPDLCDLESHTEPFGTTGKYIRLSEALGVSVDALLHNDFRKITSSFFDRFPAPVFTKSWATESYDLGYAGELLILKREQERVSRLYPDLARLVLPVCHMDLPSPGFDILSFDDDGVPFAIEVKTSTTASQAFRLTVNEYTSAKLITEAGQTYMICCISNFGTDKQTIDDIPFQQLLQTYKIQPTSYQCLPLPEPQPISGLGYHRRLQGYQQRELAGWMGISPGNLCNAETNGLLLSAPVYLRASKILGVPVDDLIATYPCAPEEPTSL